MQSPELCSHAGVSAGHSNVYLAMRSVTHTYKPVAHLDASTRATFLMRTYGHLVGAVLLFVVLELWYFSTGIADSIAAALLSVSWLMVLGAFLVVGWLASRAAHTSRSMPMQYLALGGFVVAESLIFAPLLYIANSVAPGAIESAAQVTILGFALLTFIVYRSRCDFSFLYPMLQFGFIMALVAIVVAVIFGFQLGIFFSFGMVLLAGGAILYDTSNVFHKYPEDRYVGAALELFASVALLFWYVLSIFLSSRD